LTRVKWHGRQNMRRRESEGSRQKSIPRTQVKFFQNSLVSTILSWYTLLSCIQYSEVWNLHPSHRPRRPNLALQHARNSCIHDFALPWINVKCLRIKIIHVINSCPFFNFADSNPSNTHATPFSWMGTHRVKLGSFQLNSSMIKPSIFAVLPCPSFRHLGLEFELSVELLLLGHRDPHHLEMMFEEGSLVFG